MKIFFATYESYEAESPSIRKLKKYLNSSHEVYHYSHRVNGESGGHTFEELIDAIANADIYIGEMSLSSQTLGFQLAHALRLSKPSLYLYDERLKGTPQGLIGNIPSRLLKIKKYNADNLTSVIEDFLAFADKQIASTRTSFMSTKEIDEYVSVTARQLGISKGEQIRRMLRDAMNHTQI